MQKLPPNEEPCGSVAHAVSRTVVSIVTSAATHDERIGSRGEIGVGVNNDNSSLLRRRAHTSPYVAPSPVAQVGHVEAQSVVSTPKPRQVHRASHTRQRLLSLALLVPVLSGAAFHSPT